MGDLSALEGRSLALVGPERAYSRAMRGRTRRAVTGSFGIAAVCVLVILPGTALGATASISIKRVFYAAAPGEVNNLTVSLSGTDYVLTDSGATVVAGPGCTAAGNTATCPGTGIIGLTLSGDDGADSLTNSTSTPSTFSGGDGNDSLEGGSGNDTLRGNQGVDSLSGGAGDDLIDSRGDRSDIVSCGIGNDTVRADGTDLVASDCETVDRGGAPPSAARAHIRCISNSRRPAWTGRDGHAGQGCMRGRQARHGGRRPHCRHGLWRQPLRPAGK